MTATVTIDKAGRLVVPKPMRDALHLTAGAELEIQRTGDEITLRPPQTSPQLVKKKGMWVLQCSGPLRVSAVDLIDQDREDRIQTLLRRTLGEEDSR